MWYGADDPTNVNNGIVAPPNGLFYSDQLITLASITDGTSNTAAFSEHVMGDFSNSIVTDFSDTFEPGTHPLTSDDAYKMCLATNINNLSTQGYSNVGAPVDLRLSLHDELLALGPAEQPVVHVPAVADLDHRQQPAPRRSQRGPGRRLGAVHQVHDQHPDLACAGHP